eukprot:Nk52_evm1s2242 gene=Nk52_evmTU1s2242
MNVTDLRNSSKMVYKNGPEYEAGIWQLDAVSCGMFSPLVAIQSSHGGDSTEWYAMYVKNPKIFRSYYRLVFAIAYTKHSLPSLWLSSTSTCSKYANKSNARTFTEATDFDVLEADICLDDYPHSEEDDDYQNISKAIPFLCSDDRGFDDTDTGFPKPESVTRSGNLHSPQREKAKLQGPEKWKFSMANYPSLVEEQFEGLIEQLKLNSED